MCTLVFSLLGCRANGESSDNIFSTCVGAQTLCSSTRLSVSKEWCRIVLCCMKLDKTASFLHLTQLGRENEMQIVSFYGHLALWLPTRRRHATQRYTDAEDDDLKFNFTKWICRNCKTCRCWLKLKRKCKWQNEKDCLTLIRRVRETTTRMMLGGLAATWSQC